MTNQQHRATTFGPGSSSQQVVHCRRSADTRLDLERQCQSVRRLLATFCRADQYAQVLLMMLAQPARNLARLLLTARGQATLLISLTANGIGRFPLAAIRNEPLTSLTRDLGFWAADDDGKARVTDRGRTFVDEVLT